MDIKEKIEELVEKIQSDKTILEKFRKDPVATVEGLVGIDLPKDQLEKLAEAVKAMIGMDKLGDALGGLGSLFGRK